MGSVDFWSKFYSRFTVQPYRCRHDDGLSVRKSDNILLWLTELSLNPVSLSHL